ncbi:carboxypeptidase regulatory-like domain-containing protein [Lysobacter cavernae]|uniref:Carboxypeptidase regulatory-like domain-containing protein n=1 Tax=Lysobacter cavernae TaxID=1685901 RepID=A0ABV7RQM1_9GAMM
MSALTTDLPASALPWLVAGLLALAVVLASARLLYRQLRGDAAQRSRGWRLALLLLGQPLCAALLYAALLPPTRPGEAGTMVVATAGATAAQLDARTTGDTLVALPEAPSLAGAEPVPDLATALRRHPGTQRLRVVGAGLEARDRDAVRGLALAFQPPALPRGLVELSAPQRVAAGAGFFIGGRAAALPGGSAELLDPTLQRVDRVALPADGRFTLSATARVTGPARFTLRLRPGGSPLGGRDAQQQIVADTGVPLLITADSAPRVLLLAGAPNPELKYLRRWARDAGLPLHTQISVGGGLQLGDAPIALNAANLARFDLVVLDERAWSALGDAPRAALVEALRGGLGVVLRVTAALSDNERRRLRALGFALDAGRDAAVVQLPHTARDDDAQRARIGPGTRDAPRSRDDAIAEAPMLTRRAVRLAATDASPLLHDATGTWLAAWRAEGRGRIAVSTLTDSYRLVLAGRDDLHGELWSTVFATLARAQSERLAVVEGEARQGQRVALCGVTAAARVVTPSGAAVTLLPDPSTGARACAGFWPREAGWHRLQQGDRAQLFAVIAHGDAPGLHAAALRDATLRLAGAPGGTTAAAPARHPGPRWPWWLAWLLASAGLWWLERARAGHVGDASARAADG